MKRVGLNNICACLGVRIFSYEAAAEIIRKLHLEQATKKNSSVCCLCHKTPIIFFDGTRLTLTIRLSVATALGYFCLGYLNESGVGKLTIRERLKANLFAVRLLLRLAKVNRYFSVDTVQAEKDYHSAACHEGEYLPYPEHKKIVEEH